MWPFSLYNHAATQSPARLSEGLFGLGGAFWICVLAAPNGRNYSDSSAPSGLVDGWMRLS